MPSGKIVKIVEGENQEKNETKVSMNKYVSMEKAENNKPFQYSLIKTDKK